MQKLISIKIVMVPTRGRNVVKSPTVCNSSELVDQSGTVKSERPYANMHELTVFFSNTT